MVQGANVSLTVVGWIPIGVAGVSQGTLSPLTKVVQVMLATAFLSPLLVLFSKTRFPLAKDFTLAMVGVFVASTYWELLSQLTVVPMSVHIGIFLVGTLATSFLFIGKPMTSRNYRSRIPALRAQGS